MVTPCFTTVLWISLPTQLPPCSTGHVDDDRAETHAFDHVFGEEHGSFFPGDERGGDHDVGILDMVRQVLLLLGKKIVRHFLDITAFGFYGTAADTMNFPPSDSPVPWFRPDVGYFTRPRPAVLRGHGLKAGHMPPAPT